jgi:predicted PurR-regulated permease PerM
MTIKTQTNDHGRIARYILVITLLLLSGWMLRRFIPALAWSVILAVTTWPWYERFARWVRSDTDRFWPALIFTALIALALVAPLVFGGVIAVRQALTIAHQLADHPANTLSLPDWITQLPFIGEWAQQKINDLFSEQSISVMHTPVAQWTRALGVQVARRVVIFGFTIMCLYFVYVHGKYLAEAVRRALAKLFDTNVQPLLDRAVKAIRATVDGIVLLAIAEGAVMCGVYAVAGVPHPILAGVITGFLAMVPFAAPIAFLSIAASIASTHMGAAIAITVVGAVMLFIVDHFVRPAIIGDAAKLPFLWVLLGILGGLESFGLIGLFIGPTIMAVLCSLWRDWSEARDSAQDASS